MQEWLCLATLDNGDQCGTKFSNDSRNPEIINCPYCNKRGGFIPFSMRNEYRRKRSM